MMDNISNAISDSCEPQIVPSIEPYTIDGKTVIIVTVLPEPHRPYYMKSKGRERGTYIRVAGTTRLAGSDKIKDLEMEGAKISWDELICVGYEVTDHAVKKLCHDINARRKEMQERRNSAQKLSLVKKVIPNFVIAQLLIFSVRLDWLRHGEPDCRESKTLQRSMDYLNRNL